MRYFEKIKYSFTVVNSVFIFSKCLYLKTLNKSSLSFSKIAIFGLFLFFGFSGLTQVDSLECDNGIQKAIEDSEKGIYKSYHYGCIIMGTKDWFFQDFYDDFLLKKYGIDNIYRGVANNYCYSQKMDSIIMKKFGNTIFSTTYSEAKQTHVIHLQNLIDSNYIFKWEVVDEAPHFEHGKDSLISFINLNVNSPSHTLGTVLCYFVVDTDGSLSGFKIIKGLNEDADTEVIRLLKTMPNWNPGMLNGQKVRTEVCLPIKFRL